MKLILVLGYFVFVEAFILLQWLFFHMFMDMYDPSPFLSDWGKFKNLLGIGDDYE